MGEIRPMRPLRGRASPTIIPEVRDPHEPPTVAEEQLGGQHG